MQLNNNHLMQKSLCQFCRQKSIFSQ